jgi:signal transduction histidine kinase
VVLNVLLNAHEAVEEGGAAGKIRIRTLQGQDGRVQIEIADSGVGIAESDLRRVFEPFYTTKAIGRGTGLGLAICHRIVNAAGGFVVAGLARDMSDGIGMAREQIDSGRALEKLRGLQQFRATRPA